MRRAVMLLAIFTAAATIAAAASAEESAAARALSLFEQGAERFGDEDYDGALAAFEASYSLNPVPSVLYNIAQCHRALFHHIEAIEHFERYLVAAGERVGAERRAEVEALVDELEARTGRMILEVSPPGASAELDGRPVPPDPSAGFRVPTGRHTLRVSADGYVEHVVTVEVTLAEPARVRVSLVEVGAATTTVAPVGGGTPERVPVYRRWWLWTIVGVAVAAGVGVGLGVGLTRPHVGDGDFEVTLP
jgi:hypothetical protein